MIRRRSARSAEACTGQGGRAAWGRLGAVFVLCALLFLPTPGAAQNFGQNKVQYRDLHWSILKTRHFDLYFHSGEAAVAQDVGRMAERAYARLSRILDHQIEKHVPIILYASSNEFQQTTVIPDLLGEGTGGFTEPVKRRVTVPLGGSYRDFDHVLTHELVHAFQFDILMGGSDRPTGGVLRFSPPLWFMEGMAEYLSLGEVDPLTSMWLRDGALQGYLTPIPYLEQVGDIRVYRYGQAIMAYLGATYGDHVIGEILKRVPQTRSLDRALEAVVGLTLQKFSEDWVQSMRRQYLPDIREHQQPEEFAFRLTRAERDLADMNLTPAVSPDGNRLIYFSDRALYNDLYLASALDGRSRRRLVKGERKADFESLRFYVSSMDWSPDGERIAFVALAGGKDALYVQRVADGAVLQRIRPEMDAILSPSWSPDGKWLAFSGLKAGKTQLYRIHPDGSGLEQLTDGRYLVQEPKFAPDGRHMIFVSNRGPGTDFQNLTFSQPDLVLFDLETRSYDVLPGQSGSNISPNFFPDGRHLLYVSDRTGIANLYIRDLETGEDRSITDILTGVTGVMTTSPTASLASNGKRVVFSAFSRGTWDLFAIKDPLSLWDKADPWIAPMPASVEEAGPVTPAPVAGGRTWRPDQEMGPSIPPPPVAGVPAAGKDEADQDRETVAMDSLINDAEPEVPRGRGMFGRATVEREGQFPDSSRLALDVRRVFLEERTLPDSSSFVLTPYRTRFSADYVAANGFFASNVGLAAQSVLRFSDMLGDQVLLVGANVYGTLSDADLLFEYINLKRRVGWGVSAFQFRDDYYLFASSTQDEFVSQIYRGVNLTLQRPFDRFHRIEAFVQGLDVSEELSGGIDTPYYGMSTGPGRTTYLYVSPGLALVNDNTIYGSTGPISGGRQRVSAEVGLGDLSFQTYMGDVRHYFNLRHAYALAVRGIGATSLGINRQYFSLGGPYTLRGYAFGEFRGTNLAMANVEFRFPLVEQLLLGFPLPLAVQGVRGAFFFDAGAAWSDDSQFRGMVYSGGHRRLGDIRASYGLSASLNIGFTVLRWDLAWKTDLVRNLGPAAGYLSFGLEY
jgi:Tol biopolymer transport system component